MGGDTVASGSDHSAFSRRGLAALLVIAPLSLILPRPSPPSLPRKASRVISLRSTYELCLNNKTFAHLLPKPRDVERLRQVQAGLPAHLHLGTTSWTNTDWEGLIYPPGCSSQDYIEHYAEVFGSVEIDSTWYRIPSSRAVEAWQRRTPAHFRFAAKVPRIITHEKALVDCQGEMAEFLRAMSPLGSRLGPLLLQFEYIARGRDAGEHESGVDFLRRLEAFLPHLPTDQLRFAVEVRNAKGAPRIGGPLRRHRVAPGPDQLLHHARSMALRAWLIR